MGEFTESPRAVPPGRSSRPQVEKGAVTRRGYMRKLAYLLAATFLAVVEAPYTEAQSQTLLKQLTKQFPRKPVRYVAVTHPHFDHVGGVRGMVAQGATVIAARAHESALRALIDAPHSNPPDDLATNRTLGRQVGSLQTFEEKRVITEAGQSLELYVIKGSPHVDSMVVAYVPSTHVLFQSDLFFPGTGGRSSTLIRSSSPIWS